MSDDKFDPMQEIARLRDKATRVIEQGAATVGKVVEQGIQTVQSATSGGTSIKLDVYELENSIVIKTSPIDGLVPTSIEVSMEGNVLTISGETQEDEVPAKASFLLRERKFGIFARTVTINIPVKSNEAKAKLNKNGTLTVTLPIDQDRYTNIQVTPNSE